MRIFLKISTILFALLYNTGVSAAEGNYECAVTDVLNAGNDVDFIAQNLRKEFLVTVLNEKIFVTTISNEFTNRQDVFTIINRNHIFNSIYAVAFSDLVNLSFALNEKKSDGVHRATLVVQDGLTANVWKLACLTK